MSSFVHHCPYSGRVYPAPQSCSQSLFPIACLLGGAYSAHICYFVASAGVTPISAPSTVCSIRFTSGCHLRFHSCSPQSYPLRSAVTFAPFTCMFSFHSQHHPRHYPTGLAGVLRIVFVHIPVPTPVLTVVGSPHPCPQTPCFQALPSTFLSSSVGHFFIF